MQQRASRAAASWQQSAAGSTQLSLLLLDLRCWQQQRRSNYLLSSISLPLGARLLLARHSSYLLSKGIISRYVLTRQKGTWFTLTATTAAAVAEKWHDGRYCTSCYSSRQQDHHPKMRSDPKYKYLPAAWILTQLAINRWIKKRV